jgi:SNF family Na+-dependent transporter
MKGARVTLLQTIAPISIIMSLIILSYYAVISGWVLHFFMQFLSGFFRANVEQKDFLTALMSNGFIAGWTCKCSFVGGFYCGC